MPQTHPDTVSKVLRWGDTAHASHYCLVLIPHLGRLRNPPRKLVPILRACAWSTLPPAVTNYIDGFVPRRVDAETWERIGPFVRDSVALAAPLTPYTADVLIGRATQYVAWCVSKGWNLDAETIWSRYGIDLYLADKSLPLGPDTRRNYRAWLMRMAQVLQPEENGEPRETIRATPGSIAPYSAAQMVEFRRWAGSQRVELKQYRAMLMLTLCAGAGLRSIDFDGLNPEHIEPLPGGGYIVHVQSTQPRDIPLLAEWDEWMEVLLERVPESHTTLWGPPNKARPHSLLSAFTQTTHGAPPTSPRLRETWQLTLLREVAFIKAVFRAGGVRKFDKLAQFLDQVDDVDGEQYVRFLRQANQP